MARPPGIGHNSGQRRGTGWERYCWRRARAELLGPRLPVEVIRLRVARARALGLAYPRYAAILAGSGRDIVGFLFTVRGLQLRLERRLRLPEAVRARLQMIESADLSAFAPSGEPAEAFREELSEAVAVAFAGAGPEPEPPVTWARARRAVRAVLDPLGLPGDAVVLIGEGPHEAAIAPAGNLARFIPSAEYFAPPADEAPR